MDGELALMDVKNGRIFGPCPPAPAFTEVAWTPDDARLPPPTCVVMLVVVVVVVVVDGGDGPLLRRPDISESCLDPNDERRSKGFMPRMA
ncbi:hypothetical protein BC829DRAFT_492385 [Chytridium lagenaria]|nr:hypothetical protein BC829DRAFT_492385 [Chytridium lagenaria]